ncbi:Tripeptidyl-peptidase 1, partial [Merops nubicus]
SQPACSVPPGWTHAGRVSPGHDVQLTFALRQRGVGHLAQLVEAISDPRSPQYGRYLPLEQLRDLVQPSTATLMTVLKWLQGHGGERCQSVATLDFLECRMPTRSASCAPRTPTLSLRSWLSTLTLVCSSWGSMSPSPLTHVLHHHISTVWKPLQGWGLHHCPGQPGTALDNPQGQEIVPQGQPQPPLVPCEAISSCHTTLLPPTPGAHAAVDCSFILVPWEELTLPRSVPSGRHESQEPFLAWLLLLSNMSSLPWVHSVSYGDDEDSLSRAYMERVNVEFMKAAARGLTILFASGDDGAGCRKVPSGNHTFRPSFPASSPYVTTVGGTSFKNPFLVTAEVTDYISGGGFSNV